MRLSRGLKLTLVVLGTKLGGKSGCMIKALGEVIQIVKPAAVFQLAYKFFTVETLFLRTICAFVFIEIGRRGVHFAGCMAYANGAWVKQQARQIMWELSDHIWTVREILHMPLRPVAA